MAGRDVGRLLPRHLQIIFEINARFLREVAYRYPFDPDRLRRMSIIEEGEQKYIRMAHLAIVGSCSVNGVSKLHTELLKSTVLRDFAEYWPGKFNNKTNGITPRRWLLKANPPLARLITDAIGDGWITDLDELRGLEAFAEEPAFRAAFPRRQSAQQEVLARIIETARASPSRPSRSSTFRSSGCTNTSASCCSCSTSSSSTIASRAIRAGHSARTFIFAGKAAPGYTMAKLIIKLINQVAEVINRDSEVATRSKSCSCPTIAYRWPKRSSRRPILSEQISLAGTEASGTGNMKLQLNGALTIGTLDGANVEILEEVGRENCFIFGLTADDVEQRRPWYNPWEIYNGDEEIRRAIQMIERDFFSMTEPGIFDPMTHALLDGGDHYMLLADLREYITTQDRVDAAYGDRHVGQMAIVNVARAGRFSSDRTIREYASEIWHLESCAIPPA